jgi:hypothetical protein
MGNQDEAGLYSYVPKSSLVYQRDSAPSKRPKTSDKFQRGKLRISSNYKDGVEREQMIHQNSAQRLSRHSVQRFNEDYNKERLEASQGSCAKSLLSA